MILWRYLNLIKQESEYIARKVRVCSHPRVYQIELTNACAMTCEMCPRSGMTRKIGFMSVGLFEDIISQIKVFNTHVLLHHFGDPLLHPKLNEVLQITQREKVVSSFSANPGSLTDQNIEAVCHGGLDSLILSLDSLDNERFKHIRGQKADVSVALEKMERLLSFKKRHGFLKPRIIVQMIRLKENEKEIESSKMQLNKLGVDEVFVKEFYAYGNAQNRILESAPTGFQVNKDLHFPCSFPWDSVVILWDGRVVPCCNDFDGNLVLGDLNRSSLVEIWNSDQMKRLRMAQICGVGEENKLCFGCRVKIGFPKPSAWMSNPVFRFGKFLVSRLIQRFKKLRWADYLAI